MAKRKRVSARKRRLKSAGKKTRSSDHSPENSNSTSVANESPSDWLSSIATDHVNTNQSLETSVKTPSLKEPCENGAESGLSRPETQSNKSYNSDTLTDDEGVDKASTCQPPTNGLKPNKFYGSKLKPHKFSIQKSPQLKNYSTMENTKLKTGQKKGRPGSVKRKHQCQKDHEMVDQAVKKSKKDDNISIKEKVFSSNEKYQKINGGCHRNNKDGILHIRIKENATSGCDILNNNKNYTTIITPESSSTSSLMSEDPLCLSTATNGITNGYDDFRSMNSKIKERTKEHQNSNSAKTIIDEVVLELGLLHSEDSITSGLGSVKAISLLKGQNNEYYFTSSSESSPNLNANGPLKGIETPKSSSASPDTDIESEDIGINKSGFLFRDKGAMDSSYSPSCNSNEALSSSSSSVARISPEHQTSITSFFKTSNKEINTVTSKKPGRIKKKGKKKMEQMYLDLGQRDFGHVTCATCGMVYTCAQPDDEIEHIRHHKKFVNGLRFNGWKDEHVVKEFHDGRIIMVKPDDHPSRLKKVEEVRKVVDSELGFAVDLPYRKNESKTFLFIANKKVVGCCVATQIDKGYPVLPSTPSKDSTPDRQIAAWCCSTVPVPAQCGISKIWVWNQYRRKKVATRLIDCVRSHFIYGCTIAKESLAFSDPTPDGKRLATTYIGTQEFLVFR